MAFHERWFAGPKQRRLTEAMGLVTASEGEVIEVGCWEGRSTSMIANHFHPQYIHAIDHWLGDLTNPDSPVADIAASRDVYADFAENMAELTAGNITVHRDDWRNVLTPEWTPPVRFLFIDGQHTYDEVFDNIQWALPLMVEGGVLAGDDSTVRQVHRAVTDAIGEYESHPGPGRAIWWRRF